MKANRMLAALAVNVVLCTHALADSVMQPGAWEMRTRITAGNPETGETKNVSDTTMKACLSKSFLDKDPYLKPGLDQEKAAKRGATCTISEESQRSGSASWKMSCRLQDGLVTEAIINNSATAKELRSDIAQIAIRDGQTMHMRILLTSRHIGECTPDMIEL